MYSILYWSALYILGASAGELSPQIDSSLEARAPVLNCPGGAAASGANWTDSLGFVYTVYCFKNWAAVAGSLVTVQADVLDSRQCATVCSFYNLGQPAVNCSAASYNYPGKICSLYSNDGAIQANTNNWNVAVLANSPQNETQIYKSRDADCTTDNLHTYIDSLGGTYQIYCSISIVTDPTAVVVQVATLADCALACTQYNQGNVSFPDTSCNVAMRDQASNNCTLQSGIPSLTRSNATGDFPAQDVVVANRFFLLPPQATASISSSSFLSQITSQTNYASSTTFSDEDGPNTATPTISADSTSTTLPDDPEPSFILGPGSPDASHTVSCTDTCATSTPDTCPSAPQSRYDVSEGDSYNSFLISASNITILLETSEQASACDCAEQCSIWNLIATSDTPSNCTGIEFDPTSSSVNCFVKGG